VPLKINRGCCDTEEEFEEKKKKKSVWQRNMLAGSWQYKKF
jgi:hypothetical protein